MKNLSAVDENKDVATKEYVDTGLGGKQPTLVSGTNIKTINNESVLGNGNINIETISVRHIDSSDNTQWDSENERPTQTVLQDIATHEYTILSFENVDLGEASLLTIKVYLSAKLDNDTYGIHIRQYIRFEEGDDDEDEPAAIEIWTIGNLDEENPTFYEFSKQSTTILKNFKVNGNSIVEDNVANLVTNTAYDASSNKIATMSDVENYVDLSSYSIGDTISDSTIVAKLKKDNVIVTNGTSKYRMADHSSGTYLYTVMNQLDGGDYIMLAESGNNLSVAIKDSTYWQLRIDANNKLSADLVDDTSTTNKMVTATDKTNWDAKIGPTDYASTSDAGIIKASNTYATGVSNGVLYAQYVTHDQFSSLSSNAFVAKYTLSQVLTDYLRKPYGTCDTAAGTAAKVVTNSNFKLTTGAVVFVKFTNGNSYSGTITLNVNSTGAKDVASIGTTKTMQYYCRPGEIVGFVYDGTNYVMLEGGTASTTYYGATKLSSSTNSTSEVLAATPKAVKTAYDLANGKQAALVSGTNIKTINNESILGSGNISTEEISVFKRDVNFGTPSSKYYNGQNGNYVHSKTLTQVNLVHGWLQQASAGEGFIKVDNDGESLVFPVTEGKKYTVTTNFTTNFSTTTHCKWGPSPRLSPMNNDVWTNGRDEGSLWSAKKTFTVTAYFTGYAIFQLYSSLQSGISLSNFTVQEIDDNIVTNFTYDLSYTDMLSNFDALVTAYPSYVTKTELGLSSDGTNHLYEYDFIPFDKKYYNAQSPTNSIEMPTVLMTGGLHGFEKGAIFGLFFFFKDLCENWNKDETLDYLRHNVKFKVIPVCNPYGWNNFVYVNANSVNLNRNFGNDGYTPGGSGSEYAGEAAFDQEETQIIRDFIEANLDALFYLDVHTNGKLKLDPSDADRWKKINWIDTTPGMDNYYNYILKACLAHMNELKGHFNKDYSLGLTETEDFGTVTNGTGQFTQESPTSDAWTSNKKHIMGLTFEGFNGFPTDTDRYSEDCLKAGSEMIGNFLRVLFEMYSKR